MLDVVYSTVCLMEAIYVYEDANHSLEKENILQNIDILKNVMEKTQKYLR